MADEYWIIGVDGREYGPASPDVVADWIRERRITGTTSIRKGHGPWMEARRFPELAAHFGISPVAAPPPPPRQPVAVPAVLPAEFRVWDFIGQAWDLVKPHWLPLGAMFLLQFAIAAVPYIGGCIQFVIGGAILVGIWRAVLGVIEGRTPDVGMMFQGFDRFGDAFLAMLIRNIAIFFGLLALIVPGIILAILWAFTFAVLAETRLDFWEAMRRSAILTEGYRWKIFLLALAGIPVMLLGMLALCVGVFVAQAVMFTAFGLAYRFLEEKKGLAGTMPGTPQGAAGQPA